MTDPEPTQRTTRIHASLPEPWSLTWADVNDPDRDYCVPWHDRQVEPADTEPTTVTWQRNALAANVQAVWSPDGLRVSYWASKNGVTTVRFDEAGQQVLRDALGGAS